MRFRHYLALFFLGLCVALCAAAFQSVPGYMDASYYFAGGIQLARGEGFREQILWNYLDDPAGLPHPSHAYWMPLPSLVAAFGMFITGRADFSAARLGFLALAGAIPPLTAALSFQITAQKRSAMLAGTLAAFSGFYLPYIATTDTFALSMVSGALLFLLLPRLFEGRSLIPAVVAGGIVGLFHLSRADGFIWLLVLFLAISQVPARGDSVSRLPKRAPWLVFAVFLGYGLVAGPWMVRNTFEFGTPLSPGGSRTLWLTTYDELFSYPASQLTFHRWWDSGLRAILRVRLWALGQNLQRILAEQGVILLAPLMVLGLWRCRSDLRVRAGLWGWLLTLGLMTGVFPFSGARGGLFHSCAILQPLFWALTPAGFAEFIGWGKRHRGWNPDQALPVFGGALVVFAALLSSFIFWQRVIGPDWPDLAWEQTSSHYAALEDELQRLGAYESEVVMVKNPPGYFVITDRRAVVIPDGDSYTLAKAVDRYGPRYLLLERDHTQGLDRFYRTPDKAPAWMEYLSTVGETHIFLLK